MINLIIGVFSRSLFCLMAMLKLLTFVILTTLLACTNTTSNAQSPLSLLAPKPFEAKMAATEKKILIDVRTPDEYQESHIPNAVNINWNGTFDTQVNALDKNTTVFLYCYAGGRSSSAAKALKKKGFTNIIDLEGGMEAWRNAGLPETK